MYGVFLAQSIYRHLEENTAFATAFIVSLSINWSELDVWPLLGKAAYSLALSLFNAFVVHKIKEKINKKSNATKSNSDQAGDDRSGG